MIVGNGRQLEQGVVQTLKRNIDLGAKRSIDGRHAPLRQPVQERISLSVTASLERRVSAREQPAGIGVEHLPAQKAEPQAKS
jgi:hypothetical protein